MTNYRLAIAHDYLTQKGGAERVVLSMHKAFPEAPIYTTLYDEAGTFPDFRDANVVVSPLNKIPAFRKDHRVALPFLGPISSNFEVPAEVVLTSSSGWAHGFKTEGRRLVYCHTPARWLYLADEYLGDSSRFSPKSLAVKVLSPWLKRWDQARAKDVKSRYLANSSVVQRRISDVYGINAPIIFPPHSLNVAGAQAEVPEIAKFDRGEYLLVVARLMPYKNVDKIIAATQKLGVQLVVVGNGPEKQNLQSMANSQTVILSDLSDEQLRNVYAGAKALVAASYEDFGITPLESASWGLPTIALRGGGYLDTIVENVTGLFFDHPEVGQIVASISLLDQTEWDSEKIRLHADGFSEERFISEIRREVAELLMLTDG